MFEKRLLLSRLVLKGHTQQSLANQIGMQPRTMTNRLKTGNFRLDEIAKICTVLEIKDPRPIFFSQKSNL